MNTLGQRQDDLNKKVNVTNELILEEQIERENDKKKKMTEIKFPKFNPNLATLDLDPPNIFAPPQKRKKKTFPLICQPSTIIPILLFSTFAHSHE